MPTSPSGLVLGALVADAASINAHWVYAQLFPEAYKQFIADVKGVPEFSSTIYNPFYRSPASPYGIQNFALLESFIESKGWNKASYKKQLVKKCGANTIYDNPLPVENAVVGKPLAGGWKNHGLKHFIEVVEKDGLEADGALEDDNQIDGAALVPIIATLYLHDSNFFQIVKDIVSVIQNSAKATTAALIIARFYKFVDANGFSLESVLKFIESETTDTDKDNAAAMKELLQSFDIDILDYVQKTAPGINCAAPGAVYTLLHDLVNTLKTKPGDDNVYVAAIRKTILSGGCSASRCCILGGLIAGTLGQKVVPDDWLKKVSNPQALVDLAAKVEDISKNKK